MKREQVIEVFDKHCTLVNTNYIEYIILSKSKFIDAILKLFEQEDYIPVMNRPDWDKPLFEQKESKTAITVLRDKFIEKHIINEYTDDSWMHYDDIQAALEAMEEYRQQPQKEQEDTYANGYVFCGKCGYKLGKDNPDEEDVEQDNGWQKDELGWHIPTARELNKLESGLGQQEIIKALSGEEIEDVKTVTSTDYPVEEEKPTDEEIESEASERYIYETTDIDDGYRAFVEGAKWMKDKIKQ